MALIPQSAQNSLSTAIQLLRSVAPYSREIVEVTKLLKKANLTSGNTKSTIERKFTMPGKNAAKPKAAKRGQTFTDTPSGRMRSTGGISRGMPTGGNKLRCVLRGEQALTNQALNGTYFNWALGIATTTGFPTIGSIITPLPVLAGLYREFKILGLWVKWAPYVGQNVSGGITVAVDDDPRTAAVVIASASSLSHRSPVFVTDLKMSDSLVWRPKTTKDKEARYTANLSTGTPARAEEALSFGQLVLAGSNDQAAGYALGVLYCQIEVEFEHPV